MGGGIFKGFLRYLNGVLNVCKRGGGEVILCVRGTSGTFGNLDTFGTSDTLGMRGGVGSWGRVRKVE